PWDSFIFCETGAGTLTGAALSIPEMALSLVLDATTSGAGTGTASAEPASEEVDLERWFLTTMGCRTTVTSTSSASEVDAEAELDAGMAAEGLAEGPFAVGVAARSLPGASTTSEGDCRSIVCALV